MKVSCCVSPYLDTILMSIQASPQRVQRIIRSASNGTTIMTKILSTDYLVVGAGAASMAFIDTLHTEQPDASIVVVDEHPAPGGHWNDAYGFVHLHQPSLLYGVASRQLEGNWMKLMLAKRILPWNHRASGKELLEYYENIMNDWIKSGKVKYFPNSVYDFDYNQKQKVEGKDKSIVHKFDSLDGTETHHVQVNVKLVDGVRGECIIPSTSPVNFPVDTEVVQLITPNQVYDRFHDTSKCQEKQSMKETKYIVLGCGKTAMDTVIFLIRDVRVPVDNIHWVIPNDVWMMDRDTGGPYMWAQALVKESLDFDKAALSLEKKGCFVRLDQNVLPTKLRFPVIGKDEIKYMRKVKNIVRRGRVTSIAANDGAKLRIEFDQPEAEPWIVPKDHVFVHCTCPGPFNGLKDCVLFPSEDQLNLASLFAPPVPISMSCLAMLENALQNGTLNAAFGRQLLKESGIPLGDDYKGIDADELMDHDVLKILITQYNVGGDPKEQLRPLILVSLFIALLNEDIMVGYKWLKCNRLSVFSIPAFKSRVYETLLEMQAKYQEFGFSTQEAKMVAILADKLEVLKGK